MSIPGAILPWDGACSHVEHHFQMVGPHFRCVTLDRELHAESQDKPSKNFLAGRQEVSSGKTLIGLINAGSYAA
jgi:hypothetical protein